jgi:hypothetical protein
MTLKQMVEEVREQFPNKPQTMIAFDINKVLRRYVEDTRCLYARYPIDRVTDLISEDLDIPEWKFTLPSDCFEVVSIDNYFRDWYEVYDGKLSMSYVRQGDNDIILRYSKYPTLVARESDSTDLPETLQPYIIYGVLSNYYVRSGNPQAASQYAILYRDGVAEGIRYGNLQRYRNITVTGGTTVKIAQGAQVLADGINTVVFDPLNIKGFTVTSYVIMMNGNGVEVQEYDPNVNHDQRTLTQFKVTSVGTANNFEYVVVQT